MTSGKTPAFSGKTIRRVWDAQKELWYFSVIDIIAALTNSENPSAYWRVLKKRLKDEGSSETVTKCNATRPKLSLFSVVGQVKIIAQSAGPTKRWCNSADEHKGNARMGDMKFV